MKTLYESIKSIVGIGRYTVGNRIVENGIPCTVLKNTNKEAYLLSDPVNIGTKNDFYDVSGLKGGDEKYNEILDSEHLLTDSREERPVEIYLFLDEVKDFIKNDLKKYDDWKIPSMDVLEMLNAYKSLNVQYENISATTDCWCYYDETKQNLKDLRVFSLMRNKEKWVYIIRNAQEPLRLFKVVQL